MKTATYKHNAYISHAMGDKIWVEQNLIPRLAAAGLSYCVDFEHFELGAVALDEAEKSITASRKILLIISSDYLKNNFSGFENRFARFLDPSANERRSIPIVISRCRLPNSIKQLVKIDFTSNTSDSEKAWSKLINHLKDSLPSTDAEKLTKVKISKYPLMTRIERELRMKKYHWIKAGFLVRPEDFSFTAVYFDNHLEILSSTQVKIKSLISLLKNKKISPSHSKFLRDAHALLDEVDKRSNQISEVLSYEDNHPLSIVAQKATENFSSNSETLRQILTESSLVGILDSSKVTELNRNLILQLRTLLISNQELQKHLTKIYKFATANVYIE